MRQVLTVEQVATLLQIHPESVRKLARAGRLRGSKLGTSGWRFTEDQIQAYLETQIPKGEPTQ